MEKKYESDMTRKEKWQQEKEKLGAMTLMGRIEYIWMYYKIVFVIIALVIAVVYVGVHMYQGMRENLLVSIVIVDGNNLGEAETERLEGEVKEWMKADGKYDTVRVQANIPSESIDASSQMALTTLIGAEAVDVLVCPKAVYEQYQEQNGFEEGALLYRNEGFIQEMLGATYDEVYVGVMVNAKQKEGAAEFLAYLDANAGQEPEVMK